MEPTLCMHSELILFQYPVCWCLFYPLPASLITHDTNLFIHFVQLLQDKNFVLKRVLKKLNPFVRRRCFTKYSTRLLNIIKLRRKGVLLKRKQKSGRQRTQNYKKQNELISAENCRC